MAACTQPYPQNTLAPAGPTAQKQAGLFFLVFWIAVGVFVVVEGLLLFAMFRFRERPGRETPVQVHGNTRLEVAWTIVPALLLAGVAFPTLATIFELAERPRNPAVVVDVIGHKWWWEVKYPEQGVITANEINIPAGQPVLVRLTSDELVDQAGLPVIHSFWVPRLAGKQDVVPGRVNEILIQADRPGTYLGQCAEYCGLSHYNMRFRVIAHEPTDFEAWVEGQLAEAATPTEGTDAADGETVFGNPLPQGPPPGETAALCVACHTVEPGAGGTLGPNLAHVGSRQTIAAGILPNSPEGLADWLRDPPAIKPGSKMPDYQLTDEQIEDLVAYLRSLK
jgi:cytochrome c oxidase subunit 2